MAPKPAPGRPTEPETPRINPDFCSFKLTLAQSKIHRWGIYAAEDIPRSRKIIEYTGEKINRRETKKRSNEREFNYLFTLNSYWTVDGSVGGSGAEFINHSCEPNCDARIVRDHIIYFAKRNIRKGEELTVDYNFGEDEEITVCKCGAAGCRGTINQRKKPRHKASRHAS